MKILVKGIEILIDQWNLDLIQDYNWSFNGDGYLQTWINGKMQLFHRMVAERMGLDCSDQIDHIDRNPLNNHGANLRSATHSQNGMNSKKSRNNTSGYKGVSWNKKDKKWAAYIGINNKRIYLGYFDYPIDAARAYDRAALRHFGEFAYLNFPHLKLNYYLSFLFRS